MDNQSADLLKAASKSMAPYFGKSADSHEKLAERHEEAAEAHKAFAEEHKKLTEDETVHKGFHKTACAFHKTMASHEEKCAKIHKVLSDHHHKLEECAKSVEEAEKALKAAGDNMDKGTAAPAQGPTIAEQVTDALNKALAAPALVEMIDKAISAKLAERLPLAAASAQPPAEVPAVLTPVPRTLDRAIKSESPIDTTKVDPMFKGLCEFE